MIEKLKNKNTLNLGRFKEGSKVDYEMLNGIARFNRQIGRCL